MLFRSHTDGLEQDAVEPGRIEHVADLRGVHGESAHAAARRHAADIPVHMTVAAQPKGVDALIDRFEEHLGWLGATGTLEARRRARLEQRLEALLREQLWRGFRAGVGEADWADALRALGDRRESPNRLAERLVGGPRR